MDTCVSAAGVVDRCQSEKSDTSREVLSDDKRDGTSLE